jgi:hypothetical protein
MAGEKSFRQSITEESCVQRDGVVRGEKMSVYEAVRVLWPKK